MSPDIDLTANRDFANDSDRLSLFDTVLLTTYNGARMTPAEYESLKKHERFFGEDIHLTQSDKIFYSDKEDKYIEEVRTHCYRCGKEIIIPWKKVYDLCEECDSLTKNDYRKIPWKNNRDIPNSRNARDLFSLR